MNKAAWKKTIALLKESTALHPDYIDLKIFTRLLERFIDLGKIRELKETDSVDFQLFIVFIKKVTLGDLYSESEREESDIMDLINRLSMIVTDINEKQGLCYMTFADLRDLLDIPPSPKETQKTYYLNAHALITILTKSSTGELLEFFTKAEHIAHIMHDSEKNISALLELLPFEKDDIQQSLYMSCDKEYLETLKDRIFQKNPFEYSKIDNFSYFQLFLCALHAYEFQMALNQFKSIDEKNKRNDLQPSSLLLPYIKLLLLLDKILEKRKCINQKARKAILMKVIDTAETKPSLFTPKTLTLSFLKKAKEAITPSVPADIRLKMR